MPSVTSWLYHMEIKFENIEDSTLSSMSHYRFPFYLSSDTTFSEVGFSFFSIVFEYLNISTIFLKIHTCDTS